ncbi:MAG: hypothetical protein WC541_04095 [Dehalococcoidia bacterium]
MLDETERFPDNLIRKAWQRQGGKCARCGKKLLTANKEQGTVGVWHAHPKRCDMGYDLFDNCVLLCTDLPENCHFNIGHMGHHMYTYAVLEDYDLPFLYAGTTYKRVGREYRDRLWKMSHPDFESEQ